MRQRLIVNWQDGESRRIVPVAELIVRDEAGAMPFEFGYLAGVEEAIKLGFHPFLAFPDLGQRYSSSILFPFFQNRVLPTTRPDYQEYVQSLGLEVESISYADLLGRSNGRRATDRIETVLIPEKDDQGRYLTHFFARGLRHLGGAEEAALRLKAGDQLHLVLEPSNVANQRARILTADGQPVGYLPDYLITDFDALEAANAGPIVIVERVNLPPMPRHLRVLCRMEAAWPNDFVPLRDPLLQPRVSVRSNAA